MTDKERISHVRQMIRDDDICRLYEKMGKGKEPTIRIHKDDVADVCCICGRDMKLVDVTSLECNFCHWYKCKCGKRVKIKYYANVEEDKEDVVIMEYKGKERRLE